MVQDVEGLGDAEIGLTSGDDIEEGDGKGRTAAKEVRGDTLGEARGRRTAERNTHLSMSNAQQAPWIVPRPLSMSERVIDP